MLPAQLTALRTACFGVPAAAAFIAAGDPAGLRNYLNATGSTPVWRTSLMFSDILRGFVAADWTALDNLTVGQDRIWINLREMGVLDLSSEGHRAAITECWKGTTAKTDVRDRIMLMGQRMARVVEAMLATGAGTPKTMTFEGEVQEVESVQMVFKDDGTIWTP